MSSTCTFIFLSCLPLTMSLPWNERVLFSLVRTRIEPLSSVMSACPSLPNSSSVNSTVSPSIGTRSRPIRDADVTSWCVNAQKQASRCDVAERKYSAAGCSVRRRTLLRMPQVRVCSCCQAPAQWMFSFQVDSSLQKLFYFLTILEQSVLNFMIIVRFENSKNK